MELLVDLHSWWRYVVLITAVGALDLAMLSLVKHREWDRLSDRLSFFFTLAMDIQVLIGLLVWLFPSRPRDDAFLTWGHPALMLVAVGLAHAGRAAAERAEGSRAKGARAAIFFGASIILVVIAIPLYSWPA